MKRPDKVPITAAWFRGENLRNTDEKSIVLGATKNELPNVISFTSWHLHCSCPSSGFHVNWNKDISHYITCPLFNTGMPMPNKLGDTFERSESDT